MSIRKCIYTGKISKHKDSVLPRPTLQDKEKSNWTNEVPCSEEYQELKSGRLPKETEMQANELFHLLELARLRVAWYEAKLSKLQNIIVKKMPEPKEKVRTGVSQKKKRKKDSKKKNEDYDRAEHIKNLMEGLDSKLEEQIKERSKLWD